jgi:hypothetical protein
MLILDGTIYLLILDGTFSDDIITTGMFLRDEVPCERKAFHSFITKIMM